MLEKKELLKTGKAKSLYITEDPEKLVMEYKDDTSAFDGKKIEQIAGKGTVNNRFNSHIMEHLNDNDVPNHHLEVSSPNESIVMSLDMFPIECVVRNFAAGSICKRLGLEEGMKMEPPIFEKFIWATNLLLTDVEFGIKKQKRDSIKIDLDRVLAM